MLNRGDRRRLDECFAADVCLSRVFYSSIIVALDSSPILIDSGPPHKARPSKRCEHVPECMVVRWRFVMAENTVSLAAFDVWFRLSPLVN
jgi:hypothetical protein